MLSVWILGDQLIPKHPLLADLRPTECVVVLIESLRRMRGRFHKRKVALVLAAMRHFAADLRAAGWRVDYRRAPSFTAGLRAHIREYAPTGIRVMQAAEYDARVAQGALADRLGVPVDVRPNRQMLIERHPLTFPKGTRLIHETFYRRMRQTLRVLLEPNGAPVGGQWNFDVVNRKPYNPQRLAPPPIAFPPDAVTRRAMADVEAACPDNLGSTAGFALPVSRADALAALDDFIARRLADFGPYEDAIAPDHPTLFHSVLSPLLNLGLLDPEEVVRRVERAYADGVAPIESVEGFIRQVIGWREYVYYQYHRLMPGLHARNYWQATRPLPAFFYDPDRTDLRCLRVAIRRVLDDGYGHHIERLMILCNWATLAGIDPAAVNAWFLECYIDAYDWVVTPNVIGMGLCADGGVVGTKPYIASGAYIQRQSGGAMCASCRYDPKQRTGDRACPVTTLYWDFLIRWEERLRRQPRMGPNVLALRHVSALERQAIRDQAADYLASVQ